MSHTQLTKRKRVAKELPRVAREHPMRVLRMSWTPFAVFRRKDGS